MKKPWRWIILVLVDLAVKRARILLERFLER